MFELTVALRYLRPRRRGGFVSLVSLLSALGVALGVGALIVVLSVMGGFETQLRERLLGLNAHVSVWSLGGRILNYHQLAKRLQAIPGVKAVAGVVQGQVMVVSALGASGAIIRGVQLPQALKVLGLERIMKQGTLKALARRSNPGGIVLGKVLARILGVRVGEIVKVINPMGEITPVGRLPMVRALRVVGVFDSGLYHYDSSVCYVSLGTAQELFGMGRGVSGLEIAVNDIYRAADVARQAQKVAGVGFVATDWMSANRSLFAALKLERVAMGVVLTLIVAVAAFGIVSSLVMLVMEKRREIAILRAMGATARSIRRIFMLQGLAIGTTGTLAGLGMGLGVCWALARYRFIQLPPGVYPLDTVPVDVRWGVVGVVCLCALVISLLATVYPARVAAKVGVVEALRYE